MDFYLDEVLCFISSRIFIGGTHLPAHSIHSPKKFLWLFLRAILSPPGFHSKQSLWIFSIISIFTLWGYFTERHFPVSHPLPVQNLLLLQILPYTNTTLQPYQMYSKALLYLCIHWPGRPVLIPVPHASLLQVVSLRLRCDLTRHFV